jgi:hypothetical protein
MAIGWKLDELNYSDRSIQHNFKLFRKKLSPAWTYVGVFGSAIIPKKLSPAWTYVGVFGSGAVACIFNLLSYLQVQLMGALFSNIVNMLRTPCVIVMSVRSGVYLLCNYCNTPNTMHQILFLLLSFQIIESI